MTGRTLDNYVAVVEAASAAVHGLSPRARERIDEGAYYVRLSAYDASRLIAAVDAIEAQDGDG